MLLPMQMTKWLTGKPEASGQPTSGQIVRIVRGLGHGILRAADERAMFFHRTDVADARFNDLVVGDSVAFQVIEDHVTGPRGVCVRKK
jgi:cold shock CspA family protein